MKPIRVLNTPNFNLQGVEDLQLIALLNKLNLLIDKKTAATKTYQPTAAFMIHLDGELNEVKQAITDNIKNQQHKNKELLAYLSRQTEEIKSDIAAVPAKEKDFISLQTDYNINQKVYNYLSEKKLEAHISTAAVTSGAQVIDEAIVADPNQVIQLKQIFIRILYLAGLVLRNLFHICVPQTKSLSV